MHIMRAIVVLYHLSRVLLLRSRCTPRRKRTTARRRKRCGVFPCRPYCSVVGYWGDEGAGEEERRDNCGAGPPAGDAAGRRSLSSRKTRVISRYVSPGGLGVARSDAGARVRVYLPGIVVVRWRAQVAD